jgi:energy-converting hydrogenase A subunit M
VRDFVFGFFFEEKINFKKWLHPPCRIKVDRSARRAADDLVRDLASALHLETEHVVVVLARKNDAAGPHFKERAAERPHVRRVRHTETQDNLGRAVEPRHHV